MSYFSKFPVLRYPVRDGDTFRYALVRNLLRRVALSEDTRSGEGIFLSYEIKDGERPEHIAERVYGDPAFHWIVLLTNEIIDPYHGWYKSSYAMEQYIQNKYGGLSVYFGTTTGNFYYNTGLISGSSLQQNGVSVEIIDYEPKLCKLTVRGSDISEGAATIGMSGGSSVNVTVYRVDPSYTAVHHFEVSRPVGNCGANEKVVVDPLSFQTASYSFVGGVVGTEEDEYPTVDVDGLNHTGSGVVDFFETYIGKYMGVCGSKINQYSVSNYSYENDLNESKRTIKILHPRYKKLALKELESLLRV